MRHVGLHRHGRTTTRANLLHHSVGGTGIAGIVDGHRKTLLRRKPGSGGTNAARTASDQNNRCHLHSLELGLNSSI
jgi:hypothetical protein